VICNPLVHPLEKLARLTVGYSGSDLKDVVHHGMPDIFGTEKVTEITLLTGLAQVLPSSQRRHTRCVQDGSIIVHKGIVVRLLQRDRKLDVCRALSVPV
jgi:hypothetical protein